MLGLPEDGNASMTGPEADQLPFRVMKDGLEIPPDRLPIQRAAATGTRVMAEEVDVVFRDGSTRNLYEYAVPLFNERGEVRGSVVAAVLGAAGHFAEGLASPFGLLVPVAGLLSAAVFLCEQLAPLQFAGAAVVLAGLAVTLFGARLGSIA